jgi:hypothetical protein
MSPRGSKGKAKKAKGGSAAAGIRWFAILVLSLLLWAPSGMAALEGRLSLDGALLRYAVVLALCAVGISVISRIMDAYAREQERRRREEEAAEDQEAGPADQGTARRRSEDHG